MPTTMMVSTERDIQDCMESIRKIVKDKGHCSIAFSSAGMKCTDFSLRGLPQNALMHTWLRDAAEQTFGHKCTDIELESMKRYTKTRCYSDTKHSFLIHTLINPETKQNKTELTSSSKWDKGEMTYFLDWMQQFYAEQGLILEAKGEYLDLTTSQNE